MKDETITIKEAREILGSVGESMSDVDIQNMISNFQVMCDIWLDNREKEIFDGKTLNELLIK